MSRIGIQSYLSKNKESIIYLMSDFFIKGIAFLSLPFFLGVMSTGDYGEFSLYQSYTSFFSILFALNISKGIVRYYVERKDQQMFLGTVVWIDIAVGLFFSSLFLMEETIFNFSGLSREAVIAICVGAISNTVCNLLLEDLRARRKALYYAICGCFISIISTGLGLLFVYNLENNLGWWRYISSCIPLIILAIITVIYIFRRDTQKFDYETAKYLLSYAIPLIPYALSTTIIAEVNKLVFSKIGFSAVGVYSFAVNLSSLIYISVISINRAYQPVLFMAIKDNKSPRQRLKQNMFLFFIIYYVFLLMLDILIAFFGNSDYQEAAYIVPIITAGYGYFFLYSLSVNYYYYYKKNWIISMIALGSALVIASCSYFLIPLLGYIGAALSTFIAYFLMYFLGKLYLVKKMNIQMFRWKEDLLLQAAIIIPAVVKFILEIK